MAITIKRLLLSLAKWLGAFRLSRRLTRDRLRILCYHNFSDADGSLFRPKFLLRPETLLKRLRYLEEKRFPVLGLDRALEALDSGTLPPCATVITVDDGFHGFLEHGLPLFQTFSFPITVYMTSYYAIKEHPVFPLIVEYLFWKTERRELDLTGLCPRWEGRVSLTDTLERDRVIDTLIEHGNTECDEAQRCSLVSTLEERLGVDCSRMAERRMLNLMTLPEIEKVAASGVDIQLHTHRHRFPFDQALAAREITDNRAVLEPIVGTRLRHFCYPSGIWSQQQWPWLTALEIKSATTCDPGLNDSDTPRLALRRFLDGENISQIEFEAELSGFTELARMCRSSVRRLFAFDTKARARDSVSTFHESSTVGGTR